MKVESSIRETWRCWYYQTDLAILPPTAQLLFLDINVAKDVARF
jgi:hypothetical protein